MNFLLRLKANTPHQNVRWQVEHLEGGRWQGDKLGVTGTSVWLSFLPLPLLEQDLSSFLVSGIFIRERQMDLASPWIHTQSNTNSCMHVLYIHTYIKWYTTTGANNLQNEGMVTLTNKQTPAATHSYTQRLGDGQLRKYARPSFLGSEWRSKHNSKYFPCCHLLYFLCLIHQERAQEVAREFQQLHGMARKHRIPLFPISLVFLQEPDADWGEKWWRGGTLPVPWGKLNVNFATWAHLLQSGAVW